ncbi:MAG: PEP-CTERM sorting domain-containing protein [Planctomycetota bacterium]|nr:MAG: PEP-CTERM sorting domain-containing protein [Planctomycetota bacterium]REK44263.1 MAG: PEP-CTERM sorting domain-containing protein [Planctomycetota bacterium]
MINTQRLLATLVVALLVSLGSEPAEAAFMMSYDRLTTTGAPVGSGPLVIEDEVAGQDALLGTPYELKPVSGMIDGFFFTSGSGRISPTAGPLPEINLEHNAINISGVRSRFEIKATATDFNDTGVMNTFLSSASMTALAADVVSVETFVDDSNTAFGTAIPMASFGPAAVTIASPWDDNAVDMAGVTTPFSMTIIYTFEIDSGKNLGVLANVEKLEGSGENPVPEPTTLVLGAIGLLLLGAYGRSRTKIQEMKTKRC